MFLPLREHKEGTHQTNNGGSGNSGTGGSGNNSGAKTGDDTNITFWLAAAETERERVCRGVCFPDGRTEDSA